ncbi:glycosyl transferase [Sphingobacterium mizutaii NBRC 14946 = DSM 11724]|uniref:Bactoprenol glucosyl transferase homolog from prophage CPS-53 n=2 Tax=Sphingobacterium mizutaii TaxID=1010 RepID=A0AAJ4X881_9SPHI|nr:glycosyltransferase family 2 protein [Sphingobacterium mizutaii]GEM68031.1 glycosyl transferase [Sphingobacterium mizutaii NBRC 14946 = DSM 11724]SDL77965.1 dolichol-phosphate mannosyltransferase [Sphingobacterium mizutaii]SNV37988.1 Bactoprenol glucosyl transferase homolog from prophage CPS-53 [Sphingobacterium mizutaii]
MKRLDLKISIIIPCMNEEANILPLFKNINKQLKEKYSFTVLFVDDGSNDNTLSTIKGLARSNVNVKYISLSRNFGHQMALKAGYDHVDGDAIISMDGDMQHPVEILEEMIKKWEDGYDVVSSRRQDTTSSVFKRKSSTLFYKIYNSFSKIKLNEGTADFRLIDAKVLNAFREIKESNMFIRGLIAWMGFKQYELFYTVEKRLYGKSKYSIRKMFSLSLDGFTSFSISPLRISSLVGITLSMISFIYVIYALYMHLFTHDTVPGWTSLMVCFLFVSGLQFIMIGVAGEYIGKVFLEVKNRPLYIISEDNLS